MTTQAKLSTLPSVYRQTICFGRIGANIYTPERTDAEEDLPQHEKVFLN